LGNEILADLKRLFIVSRPEFIPANMGSLIIGLAWGFNALSGFSFKLLVMTILSFLIITVVSAIGAQTNTLSDNELDSYDPRKKMLTQNLRELGNEKVKTAIIFELILSAILVSLLILLRGEPMQLTIYISAIFLTQAYSAPPLRLKARSLLAVISLCLVLSVLPAIFIYYTFAPELTPLFALFLIGQTLTVYSIIIPTETRDYFGDKAMKVMTMTVWLGLSRATLLAFALLTVGAGLSIAAFLMTPVFTNNPLLMLAPLAMVAADLYIFRAYYKLYNLSRRQEVEEGDVKGVVGEEVVELSSQNPKWITVATQAIVFVNLIYFVGKIFSR
jgi:4-hydroxybenzoate polyprenyltransferase